MKQFMFVMFAVVGNIQHSGVFANTTYVSGHITSDTTWTKANSPYVVDGDVYVDSSVTLTIEPGVEVRLGSRKYIMIYGTLNALGTEGDSILISALDTTKRWSRLWFKPASAGSLKYCRIEYAGESAIYIDTTSSPVIEYNIITNNFANYGGGIYSYYGLPMITGNIVTDNSADSSGGGIYSYYGSSTITGNAITGNSADSGYGGGIRSYGSSTITGNTITDNSAYGGGGIRSYRSPTITENTITGNSANYGGGIYNYWGSPTIIGNIITGNSAISGGGIRSYGSSTITENIISNNSAYLGGGGIFSWDGSPTITGNTITNNFAGYGGGIMNYYGSPTIKYNTIIDTTESAIYIHLHSGSGTLIDSNNLYANDYAVYNNSSSDINARYNYWGTIDSATIANQKIWDFYDDSAKGIVHYEPFLNEPLDFGIEEKTGNRQKAIGIRVYPNPFTWRTAIKLSRYSNGFCEQATKKASIQIYDLSGRFVKSYTMGRNSEIAPTTIIIGETLKSGIYFLKVQGYKPTKVVKLR